MHYAGYQDLQVWQKSIQLVIEVYRLVKLLPASELYALSSQMRRAAVSIPSNIAEGQQRKTTREFLYFLSIAKGSVAELQTHFVICNELGFFDAQQSDNAMKLTFEILKMLNALSVSIENKQK